MGGSFIRRLTDALLPRGAAWEPEAGGYMDRFMDGCAENLRAVMDDLEGLAFLLNPLKCPRELLPDLERELGITPDDTLDEEARREQLEVTQSAAGPTLVRRLQSFLAGAGFPLTVTPNGTPAVNPDGVLGNEGYYLVNGDRFNNSPIYPQGGYMYAQDYPSESSAGYYTDYGEYVDPYSGAAGIGWPLVFFVGGDVTRNLDGSIASIATVTVPFNRRQELHRLILRIKPLHSWAALKVVYA